MPHEHTRQFENRPIRSRYNCLIFRGNVKRRDHRKDRGIRGAVTEPEYQVLRVPEVLRHLRGDQVDPFLDVAADLGYSQHP